MNNISTIAIDDEPLALSLTTGYIKKSGFLDLAAEFDNPIDAMEYLADNHVDLIFLDIHMPDLTGIEFIKSLLHPPKIIFTTAYEKYALEGYKLNAIDYLLKPFSFQEFMAAAQKARKLIGLERAAVPQVEADSRFLFLKSEYKIRKIEFKDIIYIEGLKDYIKVYLESETKPLMSLNTITSLEQRLPEDNFLRVHRSFIVNLNKITTIERDRIVFGSEYIPVSDKYKDKFREFVKKNFL